MLLRFLISFLAAATLPVHSYNIAIGLKVNWNTLSFSSCSTLCTSDDCGALLLQMLVLSGSFVYEHMFFLVYIALQAHFLCVKLGVVQVRTEDIPTALR